MKSISVQIQLDVLSEISALSIVEILEKMVFCCPEEWLIKFTVESDSEYKNLNFETSNLKGMWEKIDAALGLTSQPQSVVSKGTIVVCEGEEGWGDYLLLHHFDDREETDRFESW